MHGCGSASSFGQARGWPECYARRMASVSQHTRPITASSEPQRGTARRLWVGGRLVTDAVEASAALERVRTGSGEPSRSDADAVDHGKELQGARDASGEVP